MPADQSGATCPATFRLPHSRVVVRCFMTPGHGSETHCFVQWAPRVRSKEGSRELLPRVQQWAVTWDDKAPGAGRVWQKRELG